MADTIESFVSQLKTDGIEAGRQQADEIRKAAQQEADRIIADAKAASDKMIADAKTEAGNIVARGKTELELAARDAVLKLREALGRGLQAIVAGPVVDTLNDADFLRDIIQEIVMKYVDAEIASKGTVKVDLTPEMHKKLADWAIKFIQKHIRSGVHLDMKETLHQAGFEYSLGDSTVEITADSIVSVLMDMVGPSLKDVLTTAMAKA